MSIRYLWGIVKNLGLVFSSLEYYPKEILMYLSYCLSNYKASVCLKAMIDEARFWPSIWATFSALLYWHILTIKYLSWQVWEFIWYGLSHTYEMYSCGDINTFFNQHGYFCKNNLVMLTIYFFAKSRSDTGLTEILEACRSKWSGLTDLDSGYWASGTQIILQWMTLSLFNHWDRLLNALLVYVFSLRG